MVRITLRRHSLGGWRSVQNENNTDDDSENDKESFPTPNGFSKKFKSAQETEQQNEKGIVANYLPIVCIYEK